MSLTLAALAQTETGFILFADGQRIEMPQGSDNDALETFFMTLIDSSQDGRCEILENGKTSLTIEKTGDQVTVSFQGQVETMTVAQAKANFAQAKAEGQLTACKSNMKNIGTALEMWATDHDGTYPKSLSELTPDYLKMIPDCPAARSDTYSSTYNPSTEPINYQFHCSGDHSAAGLEPGLPSYDGESGLIEQ